MTPRAKKVLRDLAIRQQVLLERYKAGEVRGLFKSIDELSAAIGGVIASLDKDVGAMTRKELTAVLSELTAVNTKVFEKTTEKLTARFGEFADFQAELEGKALEVVAPSLRIAIPKAGVAYANALAQPISATGQLLPKFISHWTEGETAKINNVVQRAWGEGWTNQRLTQAIRGTKALGFKDGIVATTKRNAEAVGRTSVQHVASTSRMATWEANKDIVTGYKWVSTLDGKTTQICRSLDGQVFKLGRGPVPPVHINCRSTTVAELDEKLGLDFLDEGATRSSVNGYVPAEQTYYDWLKTQSAGFQNQALGKTRGELFRNGGLSTEKFAALNLGRNFEPLTLDEMRKVAPSAFEKAGLN